MIKEKIYICTVKEDKNKPKRICLATELYNNRFDVLWFGMWRPFFRHQLENIRPARLVEEINRPERKVDVAKNFAWVAKKRGIK